MTCRLRIAAGVCRTLLVVSGWIKWQQELTEHESGMPPVLYSLTETETETEIYIISLSETKMETEMFCKTETKYKRKSESIKRNSN